MHLRPKIDCRVVAAGRFIAAACACGLLTCAAPAEPQVSKPKTERVLARVNGTAIYEAQVKPELERQLQKFRRYGMRQDDAALVQRLRKRILDRMIGEQLIHRESRELTIDDIDVRVDTELKALQMKYGTGERFEKYLDAHNLVMADLKETLRAKVYVAEYLKRQGITEPEIPESRIREFYEKHPENYLQKESVNVSHILIAVKGDSDPEEKKQARQKAESIHRKILSGEDFAELAQKYSQCNSAPGGGNLSYIKRGYMPPEFDQLAFAMDNGTVSRVVQTKFGFHIVKLIDKKPAGVAPYKEVREFIKEFLQQEQSKKNLAAHIAELKRKTNIVINPDES